MKKTPAPLRLQRSRRKGRGYIWPGIQNIEKGFSIYATNNLPIVYVGRPTKWGNPYGIEGIGRHRAIELYKKTMDFKKMPLHELRGKNLACWCPLDQKCHADILLKMANL